MQEYDALKSDIELFISYVKEDLPFLKLLITQLKPLRSHHIIDVWHDQEMSAGADREHEVSRHLEKASIILFLLSPDFIASDYHHNVEVSRAMSRHAVDEVSVLPILLRPTDLWIAPYNSLTVLPKNEIAVTQWSGEPFYDEAFRDIARGIREVIGEQITRLQSRRIRLYGYETQHGSVSPLWRNPELFLLDAKTYSAWSAWMKAKRSLKVEELVNATWLKVGDHGHAFTIQFSEGGNGKVFREASLFHPDSQLQGSWEILESGVLRTRIVQPEGDALAHYELDIYANCHGATHSGIEFRNGGNAPNAYFVFLPLQNTNGVKERALTAFDQLLLRDPDCARAYYAKGEILRRLRGRYGDAIEAYQRAIALKLNNSWIWYGYGDALQNVQRFEEALDAYQRSIKLYDTFLWVWYDMGQVLEKLERYEEALAAYEQALRLDPGFVKTLVHQGDTFYFLLRYREALDAYEKALQLSYDFSQSSRYTIVRGLSALGVIELTPLEHDATPDGKGQYWRYPEKSVYWSAETGVHATEGVIHEKWANLDWERGPLHYPVNEQSPTEGGKGLYQHFQGGSIFVSPEGSVYAIHGIICEKWASLDWERGLLGYPTTDAEKLPDRTGWHCHFQHGCIYWSPKTGAHEVYSAIRDRWQYLEWEQGFLGYPIGDEKDSPYRNGHISNFEHGAIYWTPETGAHAVHDTIYEKWKSLGWEGGFLGYPIDDDRKSLDGVGQISTFEHGSIYWTQETDAHVIYGALGERWALLGAEMGILGYPVSDEEFTANYQGRYQRFQRGSIYWSEATGTWEVYGAIEYRWKKLNSEWGMLGYPLTGEMGAADGKGRYSHFQHGSIYYHGDVSSSAHEVVGAIRERWASLGWEQSFLGYPLTDQSTAPDGVGQISYFQDGAIYSSESGETVVFKVRGKSLRERFKDQRVFEQVLQQARQRKPEEFSLVVYHIDHPGETNVGYYRLGRQIDANGVAAGGWNKPVELPFLEAKEQQGAGIALFDLDRSEQPSLLVLRVDHADDKNRGYYRVGKYLQTDGTMAGGWSDAIRIPDIFGTQCLGASIAVADLNRNGRPDLLVFAVIRAGEKQEGWCRVGRNLGNDGRVTGGWGDPVLVPGDFGNESSCPAIALADLDGNGQYDLLVFSMEHREDGKNYGSYRVGKRLDRNGQIMGGWGATLEIPGSFGTQSHGASVAVADLKKNGRLDLLVLTIEHHRDHPLEENRGYYRIGRNLDTTGLATGGWTNPLDVPGWFGCWNQGAGIALTTLLH